MIRRRWIGAALAALVVATGARAASREVLPLDAKWLFARGDQAGAETAAFVDSDWIPVDLPHDWAIAGPFDKDAAAAGSGGFLPTGVAWYRKHLAVPADWQGRQVIVEFDGVVERSGVWINGHHLGFRPNGYLTLRYNLTPFLHAGDNVLAVRADTAHQPASRWFTGSGIERHVRLIVADAVHVERDTTAVRVQQITPAGASVQVSTALHSKANAARTVHVETTIIAPDGRTAARTTSDPTPIDPERQVPVTLQLTIPHPRRWDPTDPALYTARLRLLDASGAEIDREEQRFGIREAVFRPDTGFWINGRNLKLKGVAIHQDGGAFGNAVPIAIYERRLRTLMALGVNAVRTAHNPFPPEFLDLCDRLGLIVMDEPFDMWTVAKTPEDYHLFFGDWSSDDARAFVRRDRNHPSVVIWSIGNEIHDTPYPLVAQSIITRLKDIFHAEDPTRPVTMALFRPNTTHDYDNGTADLLDVVGQNYRETELAKAHADKPSRRIIGTENSKERASWLVVRDDPAYAGMFLWTGADYLGEADRIGWPAIGNPAGLIDRTDVVKPIGWERASWWAATPVVKLARRVADFVDTSGLPTTVALAMPQPKGAGLMADWSPANRAAHDEQVTVFSNAPDVELRVNGRSLGRKPRNADDSPRVWRVPFVSGRVEAIGYDHGKPVARDALVTAGAPAAIRLTPRTHSIGHGFDAVGSVDVTVVDRAGTLVPDAAALLRADVRGGTLAAFDNGDNTDHTPFTSATRRASGGRALLMVRAGSGPVHIEVSAPGLKTGTATIAVTP